MERADIHMGIIAATVANSSANRKKGSKAAKPDDFIPKWDREARNPENFPTLADGD